jgi:hypothetical protein
MKPSSIDDIEIVGENIADVRKDFLKPQVVPYAQIQDWYGLPCKDDVKKI